MERGEGAERHPHQRRLEAVGAMDARRPAVGRLVGRRELALAEHAIGLAEVALGDVTIDHGDPRHEARIQRRGADRHRER
jgi:hypothetical protein